MDNNEVEVSAFHGLKVVEVPHVFRLSEYQCESNPPIMAIDHYAYLAESFASCSFLDLRKIMYG